MSRLHYADMLALTEKTKVDGGDSSIPAPVSPWEVGMATWCISLSPKPPKLPHLTFWSKQISFLEASVTAWRSYYSCEMSSVGDGQGQQCLCACVHIWSSTGEEELTANVYGQPWGAPAAYNLTAGHQVGLESYLCGSPKYPRLIVPLTCIYLGENQ